MLLAKSNNTKRAGHYYIQRRRPHPQEHMDATSSMFATLFCYGVTSQGVGLSLSDTCGWVEACLCPRYPKKSRPEVKKNCQSTVEVN